ncbi:MAG: phosphate signaling complex protein PhoU [Anaerolineaceae bacterium]
MSRETLTKQMQLIQNEVLLLGSMVEQATLRSVRTLKNRDTVEARQVFDEDHLINEKRFAIENAVIILMATQQPMAHDLRLLAAIMEVNTELERMGDYAKGIAKITMRLQDSPVSIPIRDIEKMAELAVDMLHRALSAFIAENPNLAYKISAEDDNVDAIYNQVYKTIVAGMIANPQLIDHSNLLMWVVHNLERLADRVTNICERTVFIATGELAEMDTSDEEDNQ